jgi:adenylate kinase
MNLILLGPPGTGKGTQAKVIADRLGLLHVASGDLFRDAIAAGTELGNRAQEYIDRGDLVPDGVTIDMLLERIAEPDAKAGVIYDGFPRTLQQAEALDEALGARNHEADLALLINAPDDEIIRRLSGRWLCSECGAIFHEETQPPKQAQVCDNCGSALRQRDDDKPDVVRRRLQKQRPPDEMLAYYRGRGKLVEIDGARDAKTVTSDLLEAIERSMASMAN